MHELARDLSGALNSKIVIVEQLVQEATRAAARLEAAIARAEQVGLWRHGSNRDAEEQVEAQIAAGADTETIHAKPVRGWHAASHADFPHDWTADRAGAARATAELVSRTERVYRLADQGLTSSAIAAELGEPLGEVELILSVRPSEQAQ
jgi:hypothetical protein